MSIMRYMEDEMADSQKPNVDPGQASLWTTRAPVGAAPLSEAKFDPSVSRERIKQALDDVKERTKAFAGKVSDDVLRTSVR